MSETELCRLCTNVPENTNFEANIFERNQRQLLRQIEELIGQRLKKAKVLPQHICTTCEEQTLQAHAFRQRCIQAQQLFATQIKKERSHHKKPKYSDAVSVPTEELASNDLNPIKEEQNDENGDEEEDCGATPSPLPLITEIILKDEPLNMGDNFSAEDHDGSDNSYNPLDEDQRNSTDGEEEADSLISEEMNDKSLASDSEVKPPKKAKSNMSKTEKNRLRDLTDSICELCGKHFKFKSALWSHMQRHTGERRFKCDLCPASCFLKTDLERHKRKHTGELPFACSHCDRRFMLKNHLTIHERSHTQERPYVCPTCGKAFFTSMHRKAHMVIHTGVRTHGCKTCNVAFKLRKHLLSHYRSKTHKQNEEELPINMTN